MKIGIIGNGNISKIMQKEKPDNEYIIVEKNKNYLDLNYIIITKPMFIFINEYPSYEEVIEKTKTIFIPGNALNMQIFENKYGPTDIYFSFNTPYVGRVTEYKINDRFCFINKTPIDIEQIFGVKTNDKIVLIHLSNLFLHPPKLFNYYQNSQGEEINFYHFDSNDIYLYDQYYKEIKNLVLEVFPKIKIINPFSYYDSKNATELSKKLLAIESLSTIKYSGLINELTKDRYYMDDINFKLILLLKSSSDEMKYPLILKIINFFEVHNDK